MYRTSRNLTHYSTRRDLTQFNIHQVNDNFASLLNAPSD